MKTICRILIVYAALGITLAGTSAQQKPAEKKAPAASMTRPQPGPEMGKIKFLIGTWTYTEKHEPGAMGPGGEAKGTYTAKLGPAGLSIVTDFRSTGPTGESVGHEVITWDANAKAYKFYAFTNDVAGGIISTGRWEGANLVTTGELEFAGQKIAMRGVMSDITGNSVSWQMYTGAPGTVLKLAVTGKATKK